VSPPTISVIMPAHDAAAYVGEAIDSILAQTERDLELIIVDDASSDATPDIVAGYAKRDPRVRPMRANVRSAAKARNLALEAARGEFVALMDADDIAHPERLARQLEAARRQPEVALWGTYMQRITADGVPMDEVRVGCRTLAEYEALDRTTSLIRLYGTVAFFRRDVQRAAGAFDPRFEPIEDAELWDRMAAFGPALVIPEVLQRYRQHEGSLSVRKIALQRRWYRFITRRHAHRLAGRELTAEDFEREDAKRGRLGRLDDHLRGVSQLYGRRAKIAWAKRAYAPAVAATALMILTHPGRFLRRLLPRAPHV
jgi:glycosyltransferase involved in cell wall biosynthesis